MWPMATILINGGLVIMSTNTNNDIYAGDSPPDKIGRLGGDQYAASGLSDLSLYAWIHQA